MDEAELLLGSTSCVTFELQRFVPEDTLNVVLPVRHRSWLHFFLTFEAGETRSETACLPGD